MQFKQGGRCWNPRTQRWETCPQITTGQTGPTGRTNDKYRNCCLSAPCCLDCQKLQTFRTCFVDAVFNFPGWGWSTPYSNLDPVTTGSWPLAFRSFQRAGCILGPDPQPGASNTFPITLYLDFPGIEGCYRLINMTNDDQVVVPPITTFTMFQFEGLNDGCSDFTIGVTYTIEDDGSNIVRTLVSSRVFAGIVNITDQSGWDDAVANGLC